MATLRSLNGLGPHSPELQFPNYLSRSNHHADSLLIKGISAFSHLRFQSQHQHMPKTIKCTIHIKYYFLSQIQSSQQYIFIYIYLRGHSFMNTTIQSQHIMVIPENKFHFAKTYNSFKIKTNLIDFKLTQNSFSKSTTTCKLYQLTLS
jgi:hypothetical protein